VDKQAIRHFTWTNVATIVGDIEDASLPDQIRHKMRGQVDVVLSDVSPDLTGTWDLDQARQVHLAEKSLEVAEHVLRKGGSFFVKAFHGVDLPEFRARLRKQFQTVRIVKPPASRSDSSEIYFLGLNYAGSARDGSSPEVERDGSATSDPLTLP
jgi:23S rRNA (uridine2552-2'-O)-methyltransferase